MLVFGKRYFNQNTPPNGGNNAPPPQTPPPANGGEEEKTVPYDRFKQVNDQLKTLQAELSQYQAQQKADAEKRLVDEKKWQELAEKREQELKEERTARLRLDVTLRSGLPAEFAGRLVGTTEQELLADAEKVKGFIKPTTPGTPPAPPRNGAQATFTAEQMSDPEWVLKHEKEILDAVKAASS